MLKRCQFKPSPRAIRNNIHRVTCSQCGPTDLEVRGPSVNIFFFEGPRTWSGPDLWTFSLNNFFYKKFRDRKLNFFWSNWLLTLNYTRKSVAHCSLHIVFLTKITHLVWICNLFFRLQLCHCKYLIIPLFWRKNSLSLFKIFHNPIFIILFLGSKKIGYEKSLCYQKYSSYKSAK